MEEKGRDQGQGRTIAAELGGHMTPSLGAAEPSHPAFGVSCEPNTSTDGGEWMAREGGPTQRAQVLREPHGRIILDRASARITAAATVRLGIARVAGAAAPVGLDSATSHSSRTAGGYSQAAATFRA